MKINPDGNLHIYMLNVGQGDTTLVISPEGAVILLDAKGPGKIMDLLDELGCNKTIEHLVISHPHADHFSGGNALSKSYTIETATFAPFWHSFGMGPATYRKLVAFLNDNDKTNINFLSGYSRWYPDDMMTNPADNATPEVDTLAPYLELLGPTNGLIEELEESQVFNTNHLSIIARLTWRSFRMVVAADAQMENWGPFDDEQLLEEGCKILRTAHHGSSNGTQMERLKRLNPKVLVVSSSPDTGHHLPDLASAAVFAKWDRKPGQYAVITRDTGTIHCTVTPGGSISLECYHDHYTHDVNLSRAKKLEQENNPTDWIKLLKQRTRETEEGEE